MSTIETAPFIKKTYPKLVSDRWMKYVLIASTLSFGVAALIVLL